MKSLYYLRVFFISYEFLFIASCGAIYLIFGEALGKYFDKLPMNEDALKWAMLYPIGISGWTLKNGVGVILPDTRANKVLHEWHDYWMLKAHFDVGILNSIIYILPCIGVWFLGSLNKFDGAWLFFTFAIAASINALSFYTAKISVLSSLIAIDE